MSGGVAAGACLPRGVLVVSDDDRGPGFGFGLVRFAWTRHMRGVDVARAYASVSAHECAGSLCFVFSYSLILVLCLGWAAVLFVFLFSLFFLLCFRFFRFFSSLLGYIYGRGVQVTECYFPRVLHETARASQASTLARAGGSCIDQEMDERGGGLEGAGGGGILHPLSLSGSLTLSGFVFFVLQPARRVSYLVIIRTRVCWFY